MFKKLKSIFIVEEDPGAKTNPQAPATTSKEKSQDPSPVVKPHFDKSKVKGKPNEKFLNLLLGAIEEHNMDSFDYLEYKQALQNLANMNMDEETKYKSAMAMAKTMGTDKAKLFNSASHYLNVLKKEETKFLEAFKKQQSQKLEARKKSIHDLKEAIVMKEKKIKELNEQIDAHRIDLANEEKAMNKTHAKVENTKDSFYHAFHVVADQISNDLEKMKKFLASE